jgi:hypothetical protein
LRRNAVAYRGVHFAITEAETVKLQEADGKEELRIIIQEGIEKTWDKHYLFETNKAWEALARCLSDGTLNIRRGEPPLNKCFTGGHFLVSPRGNYYVVLLMPAEVQDVARALASVTKEWLRERYFGLEFPDYEKSEEDWEHTWSSFQGLPEFFANAAKDGRHVIFTVDQ